MDGHEVLYLPVTFVAILPPLSLPLTGELRDCGTDGGRVGWRAWVLRD